MNTFILSIRDVFSKIGFARSLKDKKRSHRIKSVPKMYWKKDGRKPIKVQTDAGVEFTNRTVQIYS